MTDLVALAKSMEELNKLVSPLREKQDEIQGEIKKFGEADALNKQTLDNIKGELQKATDEIIQLKRAGVFSAEQQQGKKTQEQIERKAAFEKLIRVGSADNLNDAERKALSTLSNPDGGYFVTPDMSGEIIAKVRDMSPMRQYARVETTNKTEKKGKINNGRNGYSWGFEKQTPTETSTKQWGEWSISINKLYAYFKATEEMLEDSEYDIEGEMARDTVQAFAEGEAYGFLLGDGKLQPRGLMTAPTATTGDNARDWGTVQHFETGVNGGFAAAPNGGDVLIDAFCSLRAKYRRGAIFGMNRFTYAELMQLKDSDGQYIWKPSWNLQDSPFGMILGVPVVPDFDHMADLAENSLSIFVGNLDQAYKIVDRRGVSVVRDIYTDPSEINWYINKRVGGGLVNSEAVRFIKFT